MNKPYGPYKLSAGTHSEDVPVCDVTVKSVTPGEIEFEDGRIAQVASGSHVSLDGQKLAIYKGERKIGPGECRKGAKVTLATEVKYDQSSPPFMSSVELDKKFNSPASIKFYREIDGQAELRELRRRVAELEGKQDKPEPVRKVG